MRVCPTEAENRTRIYSKRRETTRTRRCLDLEVLNDKLAF